MTRPHLVQLQRPELRSRPWLSPVARAGAVLVGLDGERLRVRGDGTLAAVVQGGRPHPGVAADAAPRRAA